MAAPTLDRRLPVAHGKRDLFLALGVGACILALVVFAFMSLSRQSTASGGVEGVITAKNFLAQPETQITVGRDGVSSRRSAGEYSFEVRVPVEHDKVYRVTVDPVVYRSHEVGSRHYFVRGPAAKR